MTMATDARNRTHRSGEVPHSDAELEVLRTLWAHPGCHLVRSKIHRLMIQERRPTLGRVGQILSSFDEAGLVEKTIGKAQGSKNASFYRLSEKGRRRAKELGLAQREMLHFPVTEKQLAENLSLENLSRTRAPGRILTVYGFRGGLGRTTTTAFIARGLAERLVDTSGRLLAIDLNLTAPSLDRFLQSETPTSSRGFAGLLIDYHLRPKAKRALWLRAALQDERYTARTFRDQPLYFLPSGFSERDDLTVSERAEAMTLLNQALEAHQGRPTEPGEDFLSELREALLDTFTKTVIDCESGRSLGGWIATQVLAEELLICTQFEDPSPPTRDGNRAVLANFLEGQRRAVDRGRFAVLLRTDRSLGPTEIVEWASQNLVHGSAEIPDPEAAANHCAVLPIESDPRLQTLKPLREAGARPDPHSFWTPRSAHFEHVICWLRGKPAEFERPTAGELLGLQAFLRPEMSVCGREILWNQIDRWEFPEFVRWVALYFQTTDGTLRRPYSYPEPLDHRAFRRLKLDLREKFETFLKLVESAATIDPSTRVPEKSADAEEPDLRA